MKHIPTETLAELSRGEPAGRIDPSKLRRWGESLSPEEWRQYRHHALKIASREMAHLERERAGLERERANLNRYVARATEAWDELKPWVSRDLVLEKPDGSSVHQLCQALASGDALFMGIRAGFVPSDFLSAIEDADRFLVEHDWSKAFAGATDFDDGEFRLPYDVCTFEFRLSGWRVVALMTTVDDRVLMQIIIRGSRHWMIDDDINRHDNGKWAPYHSGRTADNNLLQHLAEFVGSQVRAISIALDAEVAEHEVIRVPEKLARARLKSGRVPPLPYHVVSLARRSRARDLPSGGEVEHGKVRLHFRRGHWRHYEDHKTWIRWMLVGNPDLGFVDKEYRL